MRAKSTQAQPTPEYPTQGWWMPALLIRECRTREWMLDLLIQECPTLE